MKNLKSIPVPCSVLNHILKGHSFRSFSLHGVINKGHKAVMSIYISLSTSAKNKFKALLNQVKLCSQHCYKFFLKTPGFFHWTVSAWVLSQYSIFLKFWTLHSSSEVENYRCEFVDTFWRTLNVPARGVYAVYVKFPCKHRTCNMFHSRSTINTIRHPLADMCDCMSEFGCTCKERDLKGKANKSWHDINLREKGNHHAIIACCELWKLLIHLPWSSGHTSH